MIQLVTLWSMTCAGMYRYSVEVANIVSASWIFTMNHPPDLACEACKKRRWHRGAGSILTEARSMFTRVLFSKFSGHVLVMRVSSCVFLLKFSR